MSEQVKVANKVTRKPAAPNMEHTVPASGERRVAKKAAAKKAPAKQKAAE